MVPFLFSNFVNYLRIRYKKLFEVILGINTR